MNAYFGYAAPLFAVATFYILARADGWRKRSSFALAIGVFAVPMMLLFIGMTDPDHLQMIALVSNAAPVLISVTSFALAMSVARKIKRLEQSHAPR